MISGEIVRRKSIGICAGIAQFHLIALGGKLWRAAEHQMFKQMSEAAFARLTSFREPETTINTETMFG